MASKASRTLDTLETDIRKLRKKARQLEAQLDDNFTYFQQHSGTLFVRSLLPRRMEGEAVTGNPVIDPFLQNERLQKVLAKLADMLAERLGDGLNWMINRVFKK
ncbi:MAG: hypothetical protein J0H74_20475 [Chitinophagaceae bacterium]|nr:hypothetical protein [Chitinophagaceae bacterium]